MELYLPAQQPFSLQAVIRSHGWIRLAPFRYQDQANWFNYVIRLDSGSVVDLHIQDAQDGVQLKVDNSLSETECDSITRAASWMLGLDQDFSTFYKIAQTEPKLEHLVTAARGRILRSPTLFEDIIKTILTTNTLWAGTIRMAETLVAIYGDPIPDDPSRRAFPTPERLADLDESALRSSARLGYRAPYVLELSRQVASGNLDLESLKNSDLPTEQLRARLMDIKGVGSYAAANLLMILGRYDNIPVDSWALKMVSNEWFSGEPIGKAEVESAFERWGEWKGLAYWFWDWSTKD